PKQFEIDSIVAKKVVADDPRILGGYLANIVRNLVVVPAKFLRFQPGQTVGGHAMKDFFNPGHVVGCIPGCNCECTREQLEGRAEDVLMSRLAAAASPWPWRLNHPGTALQPSDDEAESRRREGGKLNQ